MTQDVVLVLEGHTATITTCRVAGRTLHVRPLLIFCYRGATYNGSPPTARMCIYIYLALRRPGGGARNGAAIG